LGVVRSIHFDSVAVKSNQQMLTMMGMA